MAMVKSGGTPAVDALVRADADFSLHEYNHDGDANFGVEAATKLGLPPDQVFKTLVATVDTSAHLAVVPVSATLDLKALASAVGGKRAVMAPVVDAERITGYVAGGISPFGTKRRLPTVLDASATGFDRIYVSGGKRGLDVGLAPSVLVELLGATVAAVARWS